MAVVCNCVLPDSQKPCFQCRDKMLGDRTWYRFGDSGGFLPPPTFPSAPIPTTPVMVLTRDELADIIKRAVKEALSSSPE
jgi:hypothetical protein